MTDLLRGYNKDLGYKIPTTVDPEDAICIRVYVPKDTLYIGAFWSAYQYFTSWVAWERDAEHRAKDAAAVWRFWFDQARAEYDISGGNCDMANDVRQKPDSPCVLQKKVAGAWTDFADLRLCVPKMRFFNGVLQQDTTGNGEWTDAKGISDPPYEEKTDGPFTPAWASPPAGQTGDCLSANNVARWIMYIVFTFATSFAGGAVLGSVISSVVTYVAAVMTMGVASGVSILLTGAYAWQATEWQDVADYCVTATLKLQELMFCKFDADGSITQANFLDLVGDCEEWQSTLVGNDAAVRCWSMILGLLGLLGNVGLSRAGNIWGVTEADCGSIVCPQSWTHVFDFRLGTHGFTVEGSSGGGGQLVSGIGWVSTAHGSGHAISIIKTIDENEAVCTKVREYISYSAGLTNRWDILSGTEGDVHVFSNEYYTAKESLSWETWNGALTAPVYLNVNPSRSGSGEIVIQQIEVSGYGVDPWE